MLLYIPLSLFLYWAIRSKRHEAHSPKDKANFWAASVASMLPLTTALQATQNDWSIAEYFVVLPFMLVILCVPTYFIVFWINSLRAKKTQKVTPAERGTAPQVPDIEGRFYEQALAESQNGNRDPSLWAKAYAEGTDEEMSKRLYVKFRAEALAQKADFDTRAEKDETSIFDSVMGFLWNLWLFFWALLVLGIFLLIYFYE